MNQEEVWDKIAGKWNAFRDRPTREVLDFLKGERGKVLDLGCGSGRHFVEQDGLEMYGVDFSEELLELAKKKGYVEVKKGDVSAIPYGDEFFDCVVFNAVLHCVENEVERRNALCECFRVLKSDGEMMISVWGQKGCERIGGKREGFASWSVGDEKVERYTYIYDLEELRAELVDVGFEVLSFEENKNVVFVVRKNEG